MTIIEYLNKLADRYLPLEDWSIMKSVIYECKACESIFNDDTAACLHYWKEHDEYVATGDLVVFFNVSGRK